MPGNDPVYRNIWSPVQKVAIDGIDVTPNGRQFHTWGPATKKCSATNSGAVNRRLDKARGRTGRVKPSTTWKVGNVGERTKVQRCTATEDLVYTIPQT